MVRLVERAVVDDAFELAVTVTEPLPSPDAGASVAHVAPLDAVHAQFAPLAVMAIAAEPPTVASGLESAEASTVTLHGVASCVIVYGWPPTVNVPLRGKVVEFGSTE